MDSTPFVLLGKRKPRGSLTSPFPHCSHHQSLLALPAKASQNLTHSPPLCANLVTSPPSWNAPWTPSRVSWSPPFVLKPVSPQQPPRPFGRASAWKSSPRSTKDGSWHLRLWSGTAGSRGAAQATPSPLTTEHSAPPTAPPDKPHWMNSPYRKVGVLTSKKEGGILRRQKQWLGSMCSWWNSHRFKMEWEK